jgi:hypothetical protein
MGLYRITLTSNGVVTVQDFLGLQAYLPEALFTSQGAKFGSTVVFDVPSTAWDNVRRVLSNLAQRRIPALDSLGVPLGTGKNMPLLTYQAEEIPGDRPRIHRVETPDNGGGVVSVSLGGAAQRILLFGENLISGLQAQTVLQRVSAQPIYAYPGTQSFPDPVNGLLVKSVRKGPEGNLISLIILAAAASSSVLTRILGDGSVEVTVTPLAGSSTSTAIAALVNGNTLASVFLSLTDLVPGTPIGPTASPQYGIGPSLSNLNKALFLEGGDGGGLAHLDIPSVGYTGFSSGTGFLRITAVKAGNDQNLIAVILNTSQGSNSVSVSGTTITVNRTEANPTMANVNTAINGNASAAALVASSVIGSAGTLAGFAKTWLYGGAGETPVAKVAGAAASVTAHSDTEIDLSVTGAAVTAAGALATDDALIQIQHNYKLLAARIAVIA